ncbi:MAG: thioredoxin family protein [Candidatus Wallbacteria bacterium]|nr:thioredoxin family protein [Candidatus Wallbacteria bacterium]
MKHLLGLAALLAIAIAAPARGESVAVTFGVSPAVVRAGTKAQGAIAFEMAPGYHIYGPRESLGIPTTVRVTAPQGIRIGEPKYPPTREVNFEALGGSLQLYEGKVQVTFDLEIGPGAKAGPAQIEATVDFQPCTDLMCERPRKGVKRGASLTVEGPAPSAVAVRVAGPSAAPSKASSFADALSKGILWALLAAFGWGIAASFSPCVYPMIPITISYFGGQSKDNSASKRIALAATYVLGMTLMYATLGVVAAKLGKDLGAWMVNPWVIGFLAFVLVALACSMFGLYVLQLPPRLTSWLNAGDRGGYLEAAFMGLALGFVAAPCVGPFAGSILVFVAQSGNVLVGFSTLFSFGLGMGMIFLVLAFSSGSPGLLPRSGYWMIRLERFFGYVLVGMAIYLVGNVIPGWLYLAALGAYLVLGGTFLGAFTPLPAEPSAPALWAKGLGFLGVVAGTAAVLAGLGASGLLGEGFPLSRSAGVAGAEENGGWLRSLDGAFAEARRSGKPIFADFYADYCIPCKLMDRTTFRDEAVLAALAAFVRVKVDCTDPDGPGARYKNDVLGAKNMPYLAFFDPAGKPLPEDSIQGKADTAQFLDAVSKVGARFAR